MQREIVFDRIDLFTDALAGHGISTVLFAATDEIRSTHDDNTTYRIGRVNRIECIAYRDSTILKYIAEGHDPAELEARIASLGFTVARVSRNIV